MRYLMDPLCASASNILEADKQFVRMMNEETISPILLVSPKRCHILHLDFIPENVDGWRWIEQQHGWGPCGWRFWKVDKEETFLAVGIPHSFIDFIEENTKKIKIIMPYPLALQSKSLVSVLLEFNGWVFGYDAKGRWDFCWEIHDDQGIETCAGWYPNRQLIKDDQQPTGLGRKINWKQTSPFKLWLRPLVTVGLSALLWLGIWGWNQWNLSKLSELEVLFEQQQNQKKILFNRLKQITQSTTYQELQNMFKLSQKKGDGMGLVLTMLDGQWRQGHTLLQLEKIAPGEFGLRLLSPNRSELNMILKGFSKAGWVWFVKDETPKDGVTIETQLTLRLKMTLPIEADS